MAGFHQAVAQGAQGMGLAGAGQSEGQDVDAVFHKAALGQLVQLLPQRQGHPVVLEGFPGLARGKPGLPAQPVDAPVAAVLGLLLQHFKQGSQGIAVAGGEETSTLVDRAGCISRKPWRPRRQRWYIKAATFISQSPRQGMFV